jgi:hypothetical protein
MSLPHANQFAQLLLGELIRLESGEDMLADAFMQVRNEHWGGFS